MSTPPNMELIISFNIFNKDILKIAPTIINPKMHVAIIPTLFMSKVIPPILNRYVFTFVLYANFWKLFNFY